MQQEQEEGRNHLQLALVQETDTVMPVTSGAAVLSALNSECVMRRGSRKGALPREGAR